MITGFQVPNAPDPQLAAPTLE